MHNFHTSQSLNLLVPNEVVPIEHYLKQPQRLVQAITDPRRIETVDDSVYRLSMRPLQFLGIHIEPMADLKVWSTADGSLCLEALDCQVRGPEYLSHINDTFSLGLQGKLTPQRQEFHTELTGQANLSIQLELPPPIKFMPHPVLDSAGKAFLGGILSTIKHRIERQLVEDYRHWVKMTLKRPDLTSNTGTLRSNLAQ
jgi:hypothetical protein